MLRKLSWSQLLNIRNLLITCLFAAFASLPFLAQEKSVESIRAYSFMAVFFAIVWLCIMIYSIAKVLYPANWLTVTGRIDVQYTGFFIICILIIGIGIPIAIDDNIVTISSFVVGMLSLIYFINDLVNDILFDRVQMYVDQINTLTIRKVPAMALKDDKLRKKLNDKIDQLSEAHSIALARHSKWKNKLKFK